MIYIGQKNVIFATELINWKNMKFINKDNTPIFDTFINKYGSVVNYLYPELKDVEITVSTLTQEEKESSDEDNEDSPFVCRTDKNTIKRSNEDCIKCGLNNDEEMALIAHEVGHFVVKKKEEILSDGYAAKIVDKNHLIVSLQKMKNNVNTENDDMNATFGYYTSNNVKVNIQQRIDILNKNEFKQGYTNSDPSSPEPSR